METNDINKKTAAFFTMLFCLVCCVLMPSMALAEELLTNAAHFQNPPPWLTSTKVNKVADNIQNTLEWNIQRVEVTWYYDETSFESAHGLGPMVLAVSSKSENKIRIGPRVTEKNFEQIFGHELVHVISFQKYKAAIPPWLEEGLANYIAKTSAVDYKWLATQPFPDDVRNLIHPFNGSDNHVRYHYAASQALIEMIAKKCDFRNLLRLSVGMKMEPYFDTYCGIKDINQSFKAWVLSKK